jgi:hypothetical protein
MKLIQLLLAAAVLATSPFVFAEKPDPVENPPLQIREQNLDPSGWIAVHEQGTADVSISSSTELDVNVTNDTLDVSGSTISVDNFPAVQPVTMDEGELSSVTSQYSSEFYTTAGDEIEHIFSGGPVYATTIFINNRSSDEFWIKLFTSGSDFISIADFDGVIPIHHYSFTYPIPIERIWMRCTNESEGCGPWITIIGF